MRRQDNTRADLPLTRWSAHPVLFGLGVGVLIGPAGLHLLEPHVVEDSALVESVSELVLLAALFCAGLRLRVPFEWHLWRVPLRLATLTMLATATLAAAAAHVLFGMSLIEALLLGAVLAPTDSVLASDIHAPAEVDQDAVPFTLAAEGALTSALAAPLLLLVLEFLGFGDSGSSTLGMHLLTGAWAVAAGAVVGWLVGVLMLRWLALLDSDRQGDFLEDMIVVATAVLTYVGALALRADGLIAVFVAGLAVSHGGRLRHSLRKPTPSARVLRFAGRVERFAAVLVMVLLGALLDSVDLRLRMAVFALLFLAGLRPLAVRLGLGGLGVAAAQRRPLEWFGARGAASLYCLGLAINHGFGGPFAYELAATALVVVVTSIVFSAVSAFSLGKASPGPGAVDL
ncbi:MAG TPA: cation:proton antiporter [Steroidobacteraceae bacterium]|nr:cation:proton antiporter [Steroidobacteraceae bacterium]